MKKTKKFALGLKYSLPRQDVKTCDTNNLNNLTFDIHVSETICNSSGNNPPTISQIQKHEEEQMKHMYTWFGVFTALPRCEKTHK